MGATRPGVPMDLHELASNQHGLVARWQLTGLTADAIRWQQHRGTLVPVRRGVFAVGWWDATPVRFVLAAVLAAGPGAVASHLTAAWLHRLTTIDLGEDVHVAVPRQQRQRGLRAHWVQVDPADRQTVQGVPVTGLPRTLIDVADAPALAAMLEKVPRLDVRTMRRCLDRHRGHRGTRRLRDLVATYEDPTRSKLERAFLDLYRAHRLPKPQVNVPVAGHERDFWWPARKLCVEVDGRAFHATNAQKARDARRDVDLGREGGRAFRFSYEQVVLDGARTAQDVRALLA